MGFNTLQTAQSAENDYNGLTTSAQERKLKGELVEVTEKYGEVCQEKVSLEDEIILLKDSSVNKDEHNKVSLP